MPGKILRTLSILLSAAPIAWAGEEIPDVEGQVWTVPLPPSNSTPRILGDLVCTTAEPTTLHCFRRSDGAAVWRAEHRISDALTNEEADDARANAEEAHRLQAELDLTEEAYGKDRLLSRRGGGTPEVFARMEAYATTMESHQHALEKLRPYYTPSHEPWVGWSSPTPAVGNNSLVALFGNGVVTRWAPDGTAMWRTWLGANTAKMRGWEWGVTASPVIVDDLVVVPFDHLRGLSLKDGTERWVDEVPWQHFGSPAIVTVADVSYVATPGGRILRARDGALMAQDLALVFYSSPVVDGPRVYWIGHAEHADAGAWAVGVELFKEPGTPLQIRELFRTTLPIADHSKGKRHRIFSTPALVGDRLLTTNENGTIWWTSTENGVSFVAEFSPKGLLLASPIIHDGHGYLPGARGRGGLSVLSLDTTTVVDVLDIAPSASTPARDSDGRLYVRTREELMMLRTGDTP